MPASTNLCSFWFFLYNYDPELIILSVLKLFEGMKINNSVGVKLLVVEFHNLDSSFVSHL